MHVCTVDRKATKRRCQVIESIVGSLLLFSLSLSYTHYGRLRLRLSTSGYGVCVYVVSFGPPAPYQKAPCLAAPPPSSLPPSSS